MFLDTKASCNATVRRQSQHNDKIEELSVPFKTLQVNTDATLKAATLLLPFCLPENQGMVRAPGIHRIKRRADIIAALPKSPK